VAIRETRGYCGEGLRGERLALSLSHTRTVSLALSLYRSLSHRYTHTCTLSRIQGYSTLLARLLRHEPHQELFSLALLCCFFTSNHDNGCVLRKKIECMHRRSMYYWCANLFQLHHAFVFDDNDMPHLRTHFRESLICIYIYILLR